MTHLIIARILGWSRMPTINLSGCRLEHGEVCVCICIGKS